MMSPSLIKYGAQKGLEFLDWWNRTPDDCDCSSFWAGSNFWGPVAGVGAQGYWGVKSQPAAQFGTYTLEARFDQQGCSVLESIAIKSLCGSLTG